MIVQVYEVRSAAEAAALAACGVDHIGVLVGFGAFPRELDPAAARAVFAACPPAARRVALSLSADRDAVGVVIAETRPDIIHLGASAELFSAAMTAALKARHPSCRIMRSIPVTDAGSIAVARDYQGVADFLLLDSHRPGDVQIGALGRTHDWTISRRIVETVAVPAILAGGLGPDNVGAAIRMVRPAGVDSKTRTDRADGAGKDLDKVARFVAAAKGAGV
ncbi:MAG TPA: phosphoribosylanthranilate isomerase [Stellaceae bacterium]|nr:phosphoribosylanthranilate isomerase [Stellaceae bacterium]